MTKLGSGRQQKDETQEQLLSQLEKARRQLTGQQKRSEQLENDLGETRRRSLVEKLTLLRTLTAHTGGVISVALSADGQTLVGGSANQTIKVWGT
jgi:WD40 repeat protein